MVALCNGVTLLIVVTVTFSGQWSVLAWIHLPLPAVSTSNSRGPCVLGVASKEHEVVTVTSSALPSCPLSLTLQNLTLQLGGKGRAKTCRECFRLGVDPLWFFQDQEEEGGLEPLPSFVNGGWTQQSLGGMVRGRLGKSALESLEKFKDIESDIASLVHLSSSADGTTKLLLQLDDGLQVETVIIPWSDRQKSTLCISSQVGCRQGCTFCATGRMGKLRSLSSDEILAQVYWANKICRLHEMYPIDNVVFMGMGEPADNVENVVHAAKILVDRDLFQFASRRVTISTVGPSPESFLLLGEAPAVLAWSAHASRDEVRRLLVPTTKYSMEELREGMIRALEARSKRLQTIMLEVTLLDEINDSQEDARHLCDFSKVILDRVPGVKLVVNLIPWNDIGFVSGLPMDLRQPSMERILNFQKVFVDRKIFCYIRTTRGDDESAACGQLATKKKAGIS